MATEVSVALASIWRLLSDFVVSFEHSATIEHLCKVHVECPLAESTPTTATSDQIVVALERPRGMRSHRRAASSGLLQNKIAV